VPAYELVKKDEADHENRSQYFYVLVAGGVTGRAIYIVREI
jgi:hypothetical protein